jgi:hypothetical protein
MKDNERSTKGTNRSTHEGKLAMRHRFKRRLAVALLMMIFLLPSLAFPAQATGVPTTTPDLLKDSLATSARLVVTEIMYNPPDDGEISGTNLEYVELYNPGDEPFNLSGVHFESGIEYEFAEDDVLPACAYLVLARSDTDFARKYGFSPHGGFGGQLNNAGERITLAASDGTAIVSVAYSDTPPWPTSPNGSGFSLVLRDPSNATADLSDGANWRASSGEGGSPGTADSPPDATTPKVLVNEVFPHTDEPDYDAIEIYNPTDTYADVGGWYLTDDHTEPRRFRIPDGVIVPPGNFWVFDERALDFGFSSFGEEAYIFAADALGNLTGYSHGFAFGTSPNGVSFGRHLTSEGKETFPIQSEASMGAANLGPQVGPVVIREIMYHPGPDGEEYIRLTNISNEPVRLYDVEHPQNRWRFSFRKNAVGIGDYVLPTGLVLEPGGELLIVPTDPKEFRTRYAIPSETQIMGPFSGELDNDGELIQLLQPDRQDIDGTVPYFVVDEIRYNDALPWPVEADGQGPSLQRIDLESFGNDPANWRAGAHNHIFLPTIRH